MAVKLTQQHAEAARQVLDHPVVKEILDDMEASAINGAVSANITDEIKPAAYLAEVRAIRAFRSRLSNLIAEATATAKRTEAAK